MSRLLLPQNQISKQAQKSIESFYPDIIRQVSESVQEHPIVVVGMAQNPFVKKARKALDAAGITYKYLEYGSYFAEWKARLAIKLWSGWPTFPQVFVKGQLVGGFSELREMLSKGTLKG